MICPNCQKELPPDAGHCPVCQAAVHTTGLTDERPLAAAQRAASAKTEMSEETQGAAVSAENRETAPFSVHTAKTEVWRPKTEKVRGWIGQSLNHYQVLELGEDVEEGWLLARVTVLDRALENWATDQDARLQELGREGRKRFRQLKTDLAERATYNRAQADQRRQGVIDGLAESFWDLAKTTKVLDAWLWVKLQERAASGGLRRDELEQVVETLRARGVETGLMIDGREARSLDELKDICGGEGEKLLPVYTSGELERWLLMAARESGQAEKIAELKKTHKRNPRLGAQMWLWGIGPKTLVLVEKGQRWEIARLEQWIKVLYHPDTEKADLAVVASLRMLESSILQEWLRAIGHDDLYRLARAEKFNHEKGLWLVVWRAEEKLLSASALDQRANEVAYRQTKNLLAKHAEFAEGQFYHAANCALLNRSDEMRQHLSAAIQGNREFAERAGNSLYFSRHKLAVDSLANAQLSASTLPTDQEKKPLVMPAPDKSSADGKAVEKKTSGVGKRARWLALAGGLLLLWVGWWVVEWFRLPAAAAGAVKYAALAQLNKHEGGVASLAFAHHRSWFPLPRERYVVISGGRQKWVNLWDVAAPEEPKQTLMLESEVAGAVAVSADGARLASGSDALHVVGLFGLSGGEISVSKSAAECQKEKNATAGRGDKQTGYIDVAEWNKGILVGKGCVLPQTGNEASQFRLFANVRAVAFSPDGKLLAGIGKTSEMENARVTLWNRASGKEVALNPQNKDQEIRPPMAFSSDSKLFATGGRLKIGNRTETGVLLWDLSGRAVEALIGRVRTGGDAALALAFSPDGKWLASGCDSNHFCLWEVAGMVKINKAQVADKPSARFWTDPDRRVTAKLATLAFSSDGRFLATVGEGMNKVYLWSVEDGRWVLKDSFEHNYNAPITAIAFSDDARLLAIGCASGIVTLWQQTAAR